MMASPPALWHLAAATAVGRCVLLVKWEAFENTGGCKKPVNNGLLSTNLNSVSRISESSTVGMFAVSKKPAQNGGENKMQQVSMSNHRDFLIS